MKNPRAYLKEILKNVLPKYCSGAVVDVGSGHAKYRNLIKPHADTYTTVDNLSSEYQFTGAEAKPDVIASVDDMPFPDASFDAAICTEVLEHVEEPYVVVGEIARILKPGGYAIISSGWAAPYHKEPDDYWRFSESAYKLLCVRAGLTFVESHKKGGLYTVLLYFITRNIALNSSSRLLKKICVKATWPLEHLAQVLDRSVKTEDTIGHVIIARKPLES